MGIFQSRPVENQAVDLAAENRPARNENQTNNRMALAAGNQGVEIRAVANRAAENRALGNRPARAAMPNENFVAKSLAARVLLEEYRALQVVIAENQAENRAAENRATLIQWQADVLAKIRVLSEELRTVGNEARLRHVQAHAIGRRRPARRNQRQLVWAALQNAGNQNGGPQNGNQNAQVQNVRRRQRRQPRAAPAVIEVSDEEQDFNMAANPQPINPNCPICHHSISNRRPVAMLCGHLFCKRCIEHSLRYKRECPVCRQMTKPRAPFINVYLEH